MQNKIRIGILGIGAVGGYIGARLAKKYAGSQEVEIIFIAREKTGAVILEKGLKLITPSEEFIARPAIVSNQPEEIGKLDLLVIAVKSYDLESSLLPLKECVKTGTIIIPFLNGVDAKDRIERILPGSDVWDGCVYIISRIQEPGVIKESGNIHVFYFGDDHAPAERLRKFHKLISDAGIDIRISGNILQTCWEKFLFISVVASSTSYFDRPLGPILETKERRAVLLKLLSELKAVADAKGIEFEEGIEEKTIAKMEKVPYETTSSMHSDFQKGGRTELDSLTGYVVNEGRNYCIDTPQYETVLNALKQKMQ